MSCPDRPTERLADGDPSAVSVDDPGTWPEWLMDYVSDAAGSVTSRREDGDLELPFEWQQRFVGLLGGTPLRVLHATRLLDHEVGWVREEGLVRLSPALVRKKLDGARELGVLDESTWQFLHGGHPYELDVIRANKICFALSETSFHLQPSGFWHLLSTWGGEAIYFRADEDELGRLRTLGGPAVVVAKVDLARSGPEPWIHKPLLDAFVGRYLRVGDWGAEVHYYGDVPSRGIIDIWTPGLPSYDRFSDLPR